MIIIHPSPHRAEFPDIKGSLGTSLVVQWLRICLAMPGTPVQPLAPEDPTRCEATSLCTTTEPMCCDHRSPRLWACAPQQEGPLQEKRSRAGPARGDQRKPTNEDPPWPEDKIKPNKYTEKISFLSQQLSPVSNISCQNYPIHIKRWKN